MIWLQKLLQTYAANHPFIPKETNEIDPLILAAALFGLAVMAIMFPQ